MAPVYPYSLAYFAEQLRIQTVVWDVQRSDAMSGQGSGRIINVELAPPLWIGTVALTILTIDEARQIAAKIRKLHGSQEAFLLYDPMSKFPQRDPQGVALTGRAISIGAISENRDGLSLAGLPAGFVLLPGDKMSVAYGPDQNRVAFLEVSEPVQASPTGLTPEFGVFPHVPTALAAGQAVTLIKPPCKCVIFPGSHNPGTGQRMHVEGAGFKVIQKK